MSSTNPYKWRKRDNMEEEDDKKTFSKRPSHLRGKEIGLYYAEKSRLRKQAERAAGIKRPAKVVAGVQLSESRKQEIKKLLDTTKNCTDQVNIEFKQKFNTLVNGKIEDKLNDAKTLSQDNLIDEKLKREFETRQNTTKYKDMLESRKKLPSYKLKDDIINKIASNQVVVISGETGCGKTTQVGQFILDDFVQKGKGSLCNIVCTQPRRISAISVAERVAVERAESLGQGVGYQIRLENKMPRDRGSILFCTIGVVLRRMESDACLSNITHIILDEIHERNVESDFLITLLKDVLSKRQDLKVILMSATLNAEKFSKYYGNCPHLNIPGFTYPVQEFYLEDVLQRTNFNIEPDPPRKRYMKKDDEDEFYKSFMEPYVRQLEANKTCSARVCKMLKSPRSEEGVNLDLILTLTVNICETEKDQGAILIFVTGYMEISELNKRMGQSGKFPQSKYLIIPLHSQMPTTNQRQVFNRPPQGVRKIILSTNIAETSITIDDVVFVIDCGKIKMTDFDAQTNNYTLKPHWVALANADQRKGRAGRVQPGVCFHLFSRPRNLVLEKYQKPEILRTRLENTILTIKALQIGNTAEFLSKLIDPPARDAISISLELLRRLNALNEDESLTPLGYHLAKLPISPQMGKMVVFGALFSCVDPILSVAASLDFKDAFLTPLGKEQQVDRKKRELAQGWLSDHILLHNALHEFDRRNSSSATRGNQFCWENYLSASTLMQLKKMKSQFMEYLYDINFVDSKDYKDPSFNCNSSNVSLVKAIICAGLYPNVGTAVGKKHQRGRTLDGVRVQFHPKSVIAKEIYFPSPFFVYYLKLQSTCSFIHDATIVHPLPLIFFGDKYKYNDQTSTIDLADSQLRFKSTEKTNDIIKELRDRLNLFLEYKIANPGVIKWSVSEGGIGILRAVMELITIEEIGDLYLDYDDF